MALMAMALIPLSAFAGSAIDTSRLYFVKVRLQQACDAGALAGRKFMVGTDYSPTANTRAEAFFDNNFKNGTYGATGRTRTFVKTAENQVRGTASATVPMTLMKMFGTENTTLNVTCEAKLEIPNLDMMFVLDTTGSMGQTNAGDSVTRIAALRTAVVNFFDTIEAAKTTAARTRYGFVPYSSTVNVGLLLQRDWMVNNATYQSREPADITETTSTSTAGAYITTSDTNWVFVSGTRTSLPPVQGDPESCVTPANTTKITTPSDTGWVSDGNGGETRTWTQLTNGSTFSKGNGCLITEVQYVQYKETRTQTRKPNPDKGKVTKTTSNVYWWNYKPMTFNVSSLKGTAATGLMAGGNVVTKTNGGNGSEWSDRTVTWNSSSACIEERQTVRQSDYSTIPAEAYDLDVDKIPDPTRPETQWKPWLSGLVWARNNTGYTNPTTTVTGWPSNATEAVRYNGNYINLSNYSTDFAACPTYAKKMATITRANLVVYMNALKAAGRTYHDIGFLWGMRLLSPSGLFASENATAPNGSQIARHIIFMTDGQTETNFADYDAYGLAALDRRRTDASRLPAGDSEQDTIVENRLTALCRSAQNRNTTVWVIAFGTDLTPLLSNCASPGVHAFQANNAAELNSAFASIAANIAKLRVSK